jgi:hypothetical protein
MTLIRKLASALCLALLCSSYSNAQVDSTTGNLINYGSTPTDTTSKWNNGVYVNSLTCWQPGGPGNCGPYPNVNQNNGAINFSYGQVDLNQVVNINRALAAGGTGVQLSGFNFSFTAKNGNGWDNGQQDYLAAYVKFYNAGGGLAANYDYSSQTNRRYNWTNFNFNETFSSPVAASQFSNAQVGFVGRDTNGWAGPYGPEIINVNFALKYRVDPCATNPAYSPSCTGFSNVITSNNILPQPDIWRTSMNQIVAINTALKNGGIGATVHGFNYGFDYTIGQSWSGCTATNQDGSCSWYMNIPAQASVTAQLTNSNNQLLYSRNYSLTGDGTSGSVSGQYLLPTSLNQTSLGNVRLAGSTSGTGSSIGNFSASLIYTADPCVSNPLYSTQCSGYAVAYAKNLLLGSTVASASGPIVSSGSTSISSNNGTVDQNNPQPDTQQSQQTQQQQQQQSSPPPQDATQQTAVAQADPAQPSPTQAGPATTSPQPAGGPPQTATANASSSSGPSGGGSAGPSKLAMSVLKTAQANDKATQASAVQNAAKTLEAATQSSQASSNLAISLNQDMSANSAVAAAAFSSQTTQASQQTAMQTSQQQTTQSSSTTQQTAKLNQQEQKQQQEVQQEQVQSTSIAQVQAPQQQEQQQTQTQTSTSVVKLLTPQQQEDSQQTQSQSSNIAIYQAPKQQETQQAQSQTSTSVVKLLPPVQQEQTQTQSQISAGMMVPQPTPYVAPQVQQDTQSTQVSMLKPPTPPVVEIQQSASSGTGLTVSRNLFAYNPLASSNNSSMSTTIQQSQPAYQPRLDTRQTEIETPQMPIASFGGAGRAGNPLSEIMMQQRFEMMQNNIAAPTSSVNKNVQPNELAGSIDIASMANVPAGFSAYSIVLKDASFYEPKEVYKNQKTVDNERVLRGLTRGSDSLHQRMVDQQYKAGN